MSLSSRAFFRDFLKEFQSLVDREGSERIRELWNKPSKEWSAIMLGTAESRGRNDYGLLGRLGFSYGFEVSAEWARIDQLWYQELSTPKDAWVNHVFIEHENDPTRIDYNLMKLLGVVANFKVLICYPDEDNEAVLEKIAEVLHMHGSYATHEKYLIILGYLEQSGSVGWYAYEFGSSGNRYEVSPS